MTALVACSHGTDSAEGRRTVADLVALARERMPGIRVIEAFVDVQEPRVAAVVAQHATEGDVVVVPLLLSAGLHTDVDIAEAVAPFANARRTGPLGTHPLVAQVLATRLRAAVGGTWRSGDAVVLAAAGSRSPASVRDVETTAARLAALLPVPVTIGYLAATAPRLPQAVATAREAGASRVIVASHLLASGHFARLVHSAGADIVSAPLGADPRMAEVIVQRLSAS